MNDVDVHRTVKEFVITLDVVVAVVSSFSLSVISLVLSMPGTRYRTVRTYGGYRSLFFVSRSPERIFCVFQIRASASHTHTWRRHVRTCTYTCITSFTHRRKTRMTVRHPSAFIGVIEKATSFPRIDWLNGKATPEPCCSQNHQ